MPSLRPRTALSLTPALFGVLCIVSVLGAISVGFVGESRSADRDIEQLVEIRTSQAKAVARRAAGLLENDRRDALQDAVREAATVLTAGVSIVDDHGVIVASSERGRAGTVVPLWTQGLRSVDRDLGRGVRETVVPVVSTEGFVAEVRLSYGVTVVPAGFDWESAAATLLIGIFAAGVASVLAQVWNQRVRRVARSFQNEAEALEIALDPALEELRCVFAERAYEADTVARTAHDTVIRLGREIVHGLELQGFVPAGHADRTRQWSRRLAEAAELDDRTTQLVGDVALLMDLGKASVRPSALQKSGRLDAVERESMRQHPIRGASLLDGVDSLSEVSLGVRHQMERYDGGGTPDGLRGDRIPLAARIVTIAAGYDLLTTSNRFGESMPWPDALDRMSEDRGEIFDPLLFDLFEEVVRERLPMEESDDHVVISTSEVKPYRQSEEPREADMMAEDIEAWLESCEEDLEIVVDDPDRSQDTC